MTTIQLSSEALLHLLTESLKENEALEAALREAERERRRLSRENTGLKMKLSNLRKAGIHLWAVMHAMAEKQAPSKPLSTEKDSIPPGMDAFMAWQSAVDSYQFHEQKKGGLPS